MAYDLEEQEKLDALKDWWDKHGTLIVAIVVLIAASVLGWRGWQWYQGYQAQQAMGYFEALEVAAHEPMNDADALARLKAASEVLRDDYAQSAYTSRGVLLAATALLERGAVSEAKEQLLWLIEHNHDPVATAVARLRLAAILLQQGEYEQGLRQLAHDSVGFEGLFADRRGDLYFAQGDAKAAQEQWEDALHYFANQPLSNVIQLKIDALNKE